MTLYEGIEGSCYRHAATYVRGATVLDLSPLSRASMMRILIESGAKSGIRLVPSFVAPGSEAGVTTLNDPYVSDIHSVVGEIARFPFKEKTFEVVVAFFLLNGDPHDTRLLDACDQLLGPRGTFITAVPNASWKGLRPSPRGTSMDAVALSAALGNSFGQVEILGQRLRQTSSLSVREPRGFSRLISIEMKDSLSRLVRNRPYYPGEYDFHFTTDLEDAPVLLAIASE